MKRIVVFVVLAAMVLCAGTSFAAAQPSPGATPSRIGLTLYLLDEAGNPLSDTTVLLQKNLESNEAFEGRTDGRGAVAIPNFPLTGFLLALRSDSDTVECVAGVSLYPGTRTEIMNKPEAEDSMLRESAVQNTALSRNINGTGRLNLAAPELPVNQYEVQVRTGAEGLACLFQEGPDHNLYLRGVGEGDAGEIAPEPTLPPDDEDRPAPTVRPSSTASASEASDSASPAATVSASPAPTGSEDAQQTQSAEPTTSPTPGATTAEPSPTAAATSAEPLVTPDATTQPPTTTAPPETTAPPATTAPATPTPTQAPVPSPTTAPTTLPDYVNIKLFLKNPSGQPLAYYVAVLNSVAQATCNEDGEAYFTNVPVEGTNELVVRNTAGDQVGSCGLRFVEGSETALSSVNTGGVYTIDYARGSQDVYVEIVVDAQENQEPQVIIEEASAAPIAPVIIETQAPAATTAPPSTAPTPTPGANDVIGTPTRTGPSVSGYFSNEAGIAIPGATIRLVNEDTRNLSSSITNSDGAFGVGQLPPANYSLNAIDPQGRNLGTINFTVAKGKRTQVKTASDGKTYLTEGPDDKTVYMDLRELSNGTVDLMYASKSPLTAPAVLTSFSPMPSADGGTSVSATPAPDTNLAIEEEVVDITEIERPGQDKGADAGTIVFVVVLCAMGVAVAAILLVRHARIR